MSNLNVRIENTVKKNASKTLAKMGLDLSSAVKLFLHQVITDDGLPFTPSRRSTKEIRLEWDKEIATALKNGKSYRTAAEMHADILR